MDPTMAPRHACSFLPTQVHVHRLSVLLWRVQFCERCGAGDEGSDDARLVVASPAADGGKGSWSLQEVKLDSGCIQMPVWVVV